MRTIRQSTLKIVEDRGVKCAVIEDASFWPDGKLHKFKGYKLPLISGER